MRDYLDKEGKKLEKGLYTSPIWYFTGNYDKSNHPIFNDGWGRSSSFDRDLVRGFSRLNKEDMKNEIKDSKKYTSWLEEKAREQ
jgi:hypothetical protein